MDDRRFDALTKTLGTACSRRGLARLLGGLSLVGALTGLGVDEAAAGRRIGGAACTRDRQCKTGNCLRNDTCSCSRKHPTCKPPTNPCKTVTCNFSTKRCVSRNKTDGTGCADGTCVSGVCTDCGQINLACCTNGICRAGGTCVGFPFRCVPCGDAGQPCCDPSFCAQGECTVNRICGSCGGLNQTCCIRGTCDVGLTCRMTDSKCINAL
jgi:hypothetical protein